MQSVSPTFEQRSKARMRPISYAFKMAPEKTFNSDIAFFTLDHSLLDGPDLLPTADGDAVKEWDKYVFTDYSERVVSLEWSSTFDLPDSVSVAMADVVLDNHDNFFTPGSGSSIADYILPRRPVRIYAGFGGDVLPVFVGLTESMPAIDDVAKTVTFHCVDFLDSLFNRPLDESAMYVDKRTDEILADLLDGLGLQADQYELDTGVNTIPFVYFEKGMKFGNAARKLMEAELGRLYMDERGLIRFKNRISFSTTEVMSFDGSNTVSRERSSQDDIINVVEVRAKPREVQEKQPIFQSSQSLEIVAGGTGTIWGDFNDPVTSVDEPEVGFVANTSYIEARVADDIDAAEVTSGVAISSFDDFATSAKIVIANSNAFTIYITAAELWGTPAKVIGGDDNEIYERYQNDESVEKYDEHVLTIENDFIQSENEALAIASFILYRHSELGATYNLDVKGTPALQLDDALGVTDRAGPGTYILTKQQNRIGDGQYTQRLRTTKVKYLSFFTLDQSLLDGPDVLQV